MTDPDRLILLGEIGAAHGIRGEVSIRTFTEEPAAIAAYGPLSDSTGQRSFTIVGLRVTPKAIIARLAGIDDRTAAEKLRNTGLYVKRSRLPQPEAGSYYHEDLVGLATLDAEGRTWGRIAAIVNYGAGDLLEIERGGERETLLVPFTDATVPSIDLEARSAVVLPPAYAADEDETAGQGAEPGAEPNDDSEA